MTTNYTYDTIYELTQATQGANTTESYTYDPVGNRLSSLSVASYTNNSSNELTANSNASYTYDNNGNTLTDAAGKSYTWDFENRLRQVTMPNSGGTATFKYDPFGDRIQKIYTQGPNTTTTNYLYDEGEVIETVDQNGNEVARFVHGQRIDEPLAESTTSGLDYYEQDALGSVTSQTNSLGNIIQTYTYDSFGNTTNSSGTSANPFRFTAREFDVETNLYYYRARSFDPSAGRFTSEDPVGFSGGINFYVYAWDSPTNLTDPTGLCPPEGCGPPNTHNPQPKSKCSTYPDFKHWAACEALNGNTPVGECVRGCLLDQYDPSTHKYGCDESKLHCSCFDACGFWGLRARVARTNFSCNGSLAPLLQGFVQPMGPVAPIP